MTKITCEGYRPVAKGWPVYVFDSATGTTEVEYFANQKEAGKTRQHAGIGDIRRLGSWWWSPRGLIAVYVRDERLILWVNGKAIDLMCPGVEIERGTDLLLRKHFVVRVNGTTAFSIHYSHLDDESVPDDDICLYIAETLASLEGRCRTLLLRQDKMKGREAITDEYLRELAPRVSECVRLWEQRWEKNAKS